MDDVVLIAPTPSSMHRLLSICDVYAAKYNILLVSPSVLLFILIDRGLISVVTLLLTSVPLLGHIIAPSLDESDDILQRRNCFFGQVNNIVCFFENKVGLPNSVCIKPTVIVYLAVNCGY